MDSWFRSGHRTPHRPLTLTLRQKVGALVVVLLVLCIADVASPVLAAEPACTRWRVTRDKVSVSGGAAAFVSVETAEPFAVAAMPGAAGEQWAIFTRTCER